MGLLNFTESTHVLIYVYMVMDTFYIWFINTFYLGLNKNKGIYNDQSVPDLLFISVKDLTAFGVRKKQTFISAYM